MTTINVIRHSDGRTYYPCGSQAKIPTNPKAGQTQSSNTVLWNANTRVTSLVIPRNGSVNSTNLDTWAPQASSRYYSGPVTYEKPPFRQSVTTSIAAARKNLANDPCATGLSKSVRCGK